MIQSEDFKDMTVGTEIWSVYPGKIVRCKFMGIVRTPSIWGNFPEELGIELSGYGLAFGTECQQLYLDQQEAKDAARTWLIKNRKRALYQAQAKLEEAQANMNNLTIVEIDDE